jgi:hypothetical protein
MGTNPSICIAEHTCQVEGIDIKVKCWQDGTCWEENDCHRVIASSKAYNLNYIVNLDRDSSNEMEICDKIVDSVVNKTCTAKFAGGSLDLIIPGISGKIVIHGTNADGKKDASHNAAILTCYRTQQRK